MLTSITTAEGTDTEYTGLSGRISCENNQSRARYYTIVIPIGRTMCIIILCICRSAFMLFGMNYTENSRGNSMPTIKTVPNQRVISVNKAPADKEHLYTCINLQALNTACRTL